MKTQSSSYINEQRREYSLYVLQQRALPHAGDGLKPAVRRVLWMARDGQKRKTATLAGETMKIHPHAMPDDAINTVTGPYKNNIPLFDGEGAFGTLLVPTAYGASRYTTVKVSSFTKDVLFKDIEIIPMIENYDSSMLEPKHYLPLVPMVLVNPTEGIAIGFATNILPRSLKDIIEIQIAYLKGTEKPAKEPVPTFFPLKNKAVKDGDNSYIFKGEFKRLNSSEIQVTKLPFGLLHEKFIDGLEKLIEKGIVTDYTDGSKDYIEVAVTFKRGSLNEYDDSELLKLLGLVERHTENFNVINFDGESVLNAVPVMFTKHFTEWRLQFFIKRYERLRDLINEDIQRYKDILLAIKKNVGSTARTVKSRGELKEYLSEIGIVYVDYIADLPVYRFTEDERERVEKKLEQSLKQLAEYQRLLKSEAERKKVYIKELEEIFEKYC